MAIAPASLEKLPPSNVDAEQAVIGSLLLDRDALVKISGFLHPDDFFRDSHRLVYEAMLELYRRDEPVDIVTVADELERRDRLQPSGGLGYLHSLATVVPTAIHVEYYAQIVQRTSLKRRLIAVGGRIASIGYDDWLEVDD
ncbi:MAG: replicative DNA helicase, partial [Chloroflexi bacterium]|nr:replicative DNA helicase [Chloroflexota bacterium]